MTEAPVLKTPTTSAGAPQPLENGEHLTALEFLRRYEAMPHLKKAELIEGVVIMGSPVRHTVHAKPENLIRTWLGVYETKTPGVEAAGNGTIRLDADNVAQPDAYLRIHEQFGGYSSVDPDDYLEGGPELIVEIAASTKSIDLHEKMRAYRRNGVKEYLAWRTLDAQIDWMMLEGGVYQPQRPDAQGLLRSSVFPGLALNVPAALALDGAKVVETLLAQIDSPEHREFVARLAAARSQKPKPL